MAGGRWVIGGLLSVRRNLSLLCHDVADDQASTALVDTTSNLRLLPEVRGSQ
jgi:hypothetical protein